MVALAPPLLWRAGRAPLLNAMFPPGRGAHNEGLAAKQKQTQKKKLLRAEKAPALVIVPGWLSESSQYNEMASYLSSKGFKTLVVPLKWYNWIPCLGGRSVRPILDRIEATIACALNPNEEEMQSEDGDLEYTFFDFLKEFINPKNGAQPPKDPSLKEFNVNLSNTSASKVNLVAHSAGGWICRILLGGKVPYDGRLYAASQNVRVLATLGTPHVCTDKLTKRNMDFVNDNYPGAAEVEQGVHYICIAGKFAQGQAEFGGLWKDFTWQSYELCCGEGDVWGDGVIPLECATGLEGAQRVILEGVEHFPSVRDEQVRKWYGSPEVVDKWFPLLMSQALQGQEEVAESTVT